MVSITPKSRSLANGTANDAAPVEANFTELYSNDSTLASAVTALENGQHVTATTLTLNSQFTGGNPGDMAFMVERGTLPNTGLRWRETAKQWEVTADGSAYYPLAHSLSLARFNQTAPAKYGSATSLSVAAIACTTQANDGFLYKATTTTLSTATTGLNGMALSATLTGTASSSGTTVTGTATSFTTDFVVGDVIFFETSGLGRRITAITSNTQMTISRSLTASVQSYKRGGLTDGWYYLFVVSDGTTTGLMLSPRNVAGGAALVDLPSGYTQTRQLPFAALVDTSLNFWPWHPIGPDGWVLWDAHFTRVNGSGGVTQGTTAVLLSGTAASYTAVSLAGFVPPIARRARLSAHGNTSGSDFYGAVRATGSSTSGVAVSLSGIQGGWVHDLGCSTTQGVEYVRNYGSGSLTLDVAGYLPTEVL